MFRSLASSATALIVAAAPVFAEVTPAEVWENFTAYYDDMGYQIDTGARHEDSDRLVLENLTILAGGDAMAGGSMTINAPRVVLSQTGGGDVRTVFEGDITGKISPPADAEPNGGAMDFTMSMPGNEMISSGTPDDMTHQLRYPESVLNMLIQGPEGEQMPITITVNGTTGSYHNVTGDDGKITYDMTSEDAKIALEIKPGEAGGEGPDDGTMNMMVQDLGITGEMAMPAGDFDFGTNMAEALRAGVTMDFNVTYGTMQGDVDVSGTDEEHQDHHIQGNFTGEGGDVAIAMNDKMLRYTGNGGAISAQMKTSDLPFPLTYEVASGTFDIQFPLLKSDAPQPFKLNYTLKGLQLGEQIWAMFDPTAQLPRDPADLTIDVGGDLLVKRDVMDPAINAKIAAATTPQDGEDELTPEQLEQLMALRQEAQPYQPQSIQVGQVALSALGAKIDITGQLDVPEGGEIAAPVGKLDGTFTGVNTLLDKLVAMGLMPQDQLMGTRMMMMMFARPVEGQEDTLATQLEFREGGSIFANGQQVK